MKRKIRIKVGDMELEVEGFSSATGIDELMKFMVDLKNAKETTNSNNP